MSRTPKTNHVYCPHCNSNNEPFFSRSVPMGFYCPDCGEDVDDDQTMSDTPNTREDLAAVTEQRDRLLEEREQWRMSSVCRELREQRDRLMEALQEIANEDYRGPRPWSANIAHKALAAVKGGSDDN